MPIIRPESSPVVAELPSAGTMEHIGDAEDLNQAPNADGKANGERRKRTRRKNKNKTAKQLAKKPAEKAILPVKSKTEPVIKCQVVEPTPVPHSTDSTSKLKKSRTGTEKQTTPFPFYLNPEDITTGISSGDILTGCLKISSANTSFMRAEEGDLLGDVLVESAVHRNRALDNDIVYVKLGPRSEWENKSRRTGRVVGIKEKVHPRTCIGQLRQATSTAQNVLLCPRDGKIPKVRLPAKSCEQAIGKDHSKWSEMLLFVKLVRWKCAEFAEGEILECLGPVGNLETETRGLLVENELDPNYSLPETTHCKVPEAELSRREDLRSSCIFTIDPPTAKDLDDAVSCRQLPNGNFEAGVHIADVTYFLEQSSDLDNTVAKRATSIYLVEKVHHMLPLGMCTACSLLPGRDRLAISVFWEMTPSGKVVSHRFSTSVINSCVQLAYEQAQTIIEYRSTLDDFFPKVRNGFDRSDVADAIRQLHFLACQMRQRRFDSGALKIFQPKYYFQLDPETKVPTALRAEVQRECNFLIEEFMLLANMTVARKILDEYPDVAFLRLHPPPNDQLVETLRGLLEQIGIYLDTSSAGTINSTLKKYAGEDAIGKARMLVLNKLCAKTMRRALYVPAANGSSHWHYALNVPLYTHFTSPIRRYADIMVHRLLLGCLGYREKPSWEIDYVASVASNCNQQKFNAKKAEDQSKELYLIQMIGQQGPTIAQAVVIQVRDFEFEVMLPATGTILKKHFKHIGNKVSYRIHKDENKLLSSLLLTWPAVNGLPSQERRKRLSSVGSGSSSNGYNGYNGFSSTAMTDA